VGYVGGGGRSSEYLWVNYVSTVVK